VDEQCPDITLLPGLMLSPLDFAGDMPDLAPLLNARASAFDHCGLSPPFSTPTLLNLACSLTI
jgi:hypothetical protein